MNKPERYNKGDCENCNLTLCFATPEKECPFVNSIGCHYYGKLWDKFNKYYNQEMKKKDKKISDLDNQIIDIQKKVHSYLKSYIELKKIKRIEQRGSKK